MENRRHVRIAPPQDDVGIARSGSQTSANSRCSSSSHPSDDQYVRPPSAISSAGRRRQRTISGSKAEDHLLMTDTGRRVYTKGRPPWYDSAGKALKRPLIIGICGGSASGKTTVADRIIELLEMPWVTMLSMDSFYKVLSDEAHQKAARCEYNFDHPDAFDFELLLKTLKRLRNGRQCYVPVYDFTTHRREKNQKVMYGADVIVFEGILAFHKEEIRNVMDLKIFVDTDSDTRLCRRLQRDIVQRGREVDDVMEQYFNHVKPSFDTFIAPTMKHADIIIPRGGENVVAIDLIVKQVMGDLRQRGYDASMYTRQALLTNDLHTDEMPRSLHVIAQTPQVKAIHTFIRNKQTSRDEFIFYSKRLMRILCEEALSLLPFEECTVETPQGVHYEGRRCAARSDMCCVSIMRAGETMEMALRDVVKDCKMGKILIQTNETSMEPELIYTRLPRGINQCHVFVMDAVVATGAAAMMAVRVLLDHDVPEENITLLSLLMARTGVHSVAYAFPKTRIVTTAVDTIVNHKFWIIPGMGNFGDRYYGTEHASMSPSDSDVDDAEVADAFDSLECKSPTV